MIDDAGNSLECARGEQLPHSKLTEDDVRLIRAMHRHKLERTEEINCQIKKLTEELDHLDESCSLKSIAEKFEVSKRAIERVVYYDTWRHVE